MTDTRIPVTLLTGFLGAGKTTLLNRVLADGSNGPIAVIVNEFGEAGLDHDLIESADEEVVLMQSGCLCCSMRGDLAQTFAGLLTRRDKGILDFTRVVIETTGIADPGPILQTLSADRFLARYTRLDGVVTVVDAVNGPATLDAQFEAVSQVALADLIVLSKTDLVPDAASQSVTQRLRGLNPTAPIIRPRDGEFDTAALWNLTGMRLETTPQQALTWTQPQPVQDPLTNLSGLSPTPETVSQFRPHDTDISSISIVIDEPLGDVQFDAWFDDLVTRKGRDLLRVKGILFLQGVDTPFAFHGVQQVFDPPVPLKSWDGDNRQTRIVLIGRNLDKPDIQRGLADLQSGQPSEESATS